MSNKKINIKQNVMEQIKENKISMKPKSYFILGSVFAFIGLIASVVFSIFLISIISFLLKEHGPMGDYRLALMLNNFPWWILVLAIAGLVFGIWNLSRYDFSYKTNYLYLIIIFIFAIIIAGFIIDKTGFDNLWLNQGPMRGIMRQYIQSGSNQSENMMNSQFPNGRGQRRGLMQDN